MENIDLEANLPQTNSEAADAEQIIAEIRRNRTETGAQRANDTDECVQLNRCQVLSKFKLTINQILFC